LTDQENLISELSAPVKAFRIFAIESAIRAGNSPELLKTLEARTKIETDDECLMLLKHAIASIKTRLEPQKATTANHHISPEQFARSNATEQFEILRNTSTAALKKDGGLKSIDFLWKSSANAVVKAEVVKRCSKFWPDSLASYLETGLAETSPVLQKACLEAIIIRFPKILQNNFDRLVISPDPIIRATAIRGLARKHPESAAVFLAESLRKGDYYTRLASLRAISVMPFELNRSSMIELLSREKDQRLLEVAEAIFLANPDREVPFRICDVIATTSPDKHHFLLELQKKCCVMLREAELCPDFGQYLLTLKKYPNRIKARQFVQNCIDTYENADQATKHELIELLHEKTRIPEVEEAIRAKITAGGPCELLELATKKRPAQTESASQKTQKDFQPDTLLKKLIRLRSNVEPDARALIEEAFSAEKSGSNLIPAALRAAITCNDDRWCQKSRSFLRHSHEDLVAAALEYLAVFDSESFMLQTRVFINSPSLLIRTSLLRSMCQQSPETARELLASMLSDKDARVREKAISSLIHFEFSSIHSLLPPMLARENNSETLSACLSFYIANPLMESLSDLSKLAKMRPEMKAIFENASKNIKESIVELGMATEREIDENTARIEQQQAVSEQNKEEKLEKERLEKLATKINWSQVSQTLKDFSDSTPQLKFILGGVLLLLSLFFFLTSSGDNAPVKTIEGYTPVSAAITTYLLRVEQVDSAAGSFTASSSDNQKILVLPRPGKVFAVRPGDSISVRAMPFRKLPDQTLVVKTIEVINSR